MPARAGAPRLLDELRLAAIGKMHLALRQVLFLADLHGVIGRLLDGVVLAENGGVLAIAHRARGHDGALVVERHRRLAIGAALRDTVGDCSLRRFAFAAPAAGHADEVFLAGGECPPAGFPMALRTPRRAAAVPGHLIQAGDGHALGGPLGGHGVTVAASLLRRRRTRGDEGQGRERKGKAGSALHPEVL